MAVSKFQFTNPMLLDFIFSLRDKPPKEGIPNEITPELKFHLNVTRAHDEREAAVELHLSIIQSDDDTTEEALFKIEIMMGAMFSWDENVTEEHASKYLTQNAPALLLSYMRPVVAQMTGLSPLPAYHIPFLDVRELFDESEPAVEAETSDKK